MPNSIFRQARPFLLLSALTALSALTTTAQAAAFRTTWDPVFSDAFTALVGVSVGWRGTADISVDDGCVASSTTVSFPAGCGTATLDSYELEFYDTVTSVLLGSGSGLGPGLAGVTAVSFDSVSIADGLDIDSAIDAGAFSFGSYFFSFQASLDFGLSGPTLTLTENCEYYDDVSSGCRSFVNDSEKYAPTVTWEAVPTPASLPLFGIGLVALVLMRRSTKA